MPTWFPFYCNWILSFSVFEGIWSPVNSRSFPTWATAPSSNFCKWPHLSFFFLCAVASAGLYVLSLLHLIYYSFASERIILFDVFLSLMGLNLMPLMSSEALILTKLVIYTTYVGDVSSTSSGIRYCSQARFWRVSQWPSFVTLNWEYSLEPDVSSDQLFFPHDDVASAAHFPHPFLFLVILCLLVRLWCFTLATAGL